MRTRKLTPHARAQQPDSPSFTRDAVSHKLLTQASGQARGALKKGGAVLYRGGYRRWTRTEQRHTERDTEQSTEEERSDGAHECVLKPLLEKGRAGGRVGSREPGVFSCQLPARTQSSKEWSVHKRGLSPIHENGNQPLPLASILCHLCAICGWFVQGEIHISSPFFSSHLSHLPLVCVWFVLEAACLCWRALRRRYLYCGWKFQRDFVRLFSFPGATPLLQVFSVGFLRCSRERFQASFRLLLFLSRSSGGEAQRFKGPPPGFRGTWRSRPCSRRVWVTRLTRNNSLYDSTYHVQVVEFLPFDWLAATRHTANQVPARKELP